MSRRIGSGNSLPIDGRKVRLTDVAREAKVSVMTVSNVARGRTDIVKDETRERVEQAIKQLGYRPQSFGRGLRLQKTMNVGLLIIASDEMILSSPWTGRLVTGLSNSLNSNGYGLLLHAQTPVSMSESVLLRFLQTDGLCILVTGSETEREKIITRLAATSQPILAFQETLNVKKFGDIAVIRQDERKAGYDIGCHLIAKGVRRIVFLEPSFAYFAMKERQTGIRLAIEQNGLPDLHSIVTDDESFVSVRNTVEKYVRDHGLPDAFVAANEKVAISTVNCLRDNDVRVPEDVTLACFNAFDIWSFGLQGVTTIDFPAYALGILGGETMVRRLEEGKFKVKTQVLPGVLLPESPEPKRL